jgi:hypothetical protein
MAICRNCGGSGLNPSTNNTSLCPLCDGSGQSYDPGREFEYEMGPFTLNAYANAQGASNQNSAGLASTLAALQGISCQISNYPFRCMFVMQRSTFPFTIQPSDAGSGSGRYFVPQQTQVHSENMFGDARHPMPWPTPYIFQKNQNITANVTDINGGTGTCNVTNGSPNVVWATGLWGGLNSGFNTSQAFGPPYPGVPIWNGATINIGGVLYVISNALGSGVTSQTTLVLATNYLGATANGVNYAVPNTIRIAFKGQELGPSKNT